LGFLDKFSKKKAQILNFIKIGPVTAQLLHAGGRTGRQTDRTKLKIDFCNLENARKKE
jgi:hypothetical protein